MGVDQDFFICLIFQPVTHCQLLLSALKAPRYRSIRCKTHSVHSKAPISFSLSWWGSDYLNRNNLHWQQVWRNQNRYLKSHLRVLVKSRRLFTDGSQARREGTHLNLRQVFIAENWEQLPHCPAPGHATLQKQDPELVVWKGKWATYFLSMCLSFLYPLNNFMREEFFYVFLLLFLHCSLLESIHEPWQFLEVQIWRRKIGAGLKITADGEYEEFYRFIY